MVLVVFRSVLRAEAGEAYARTAERMERLAAGMPGFISFKTFAAPDGERVALAEFESESGKNGGFVATATWVVRGSVGHWGHLHERTNGYRAKLDVRPVDGAWKIAGLELLQEERL